MTTLPLSEVKAKLSQVVEQVSSTNEEITITKNGRAAAMLISTREYLGWQDTLELLSDTQAMRGLRRAMNELKQGKVIEMSVDELMRAET